MVKKNLLVKNESFIVVINIKPFIKKVLILTLFNVLKDFFCVSDI